MAGSQSDLNCGSLGVLLKLAIDDCGTPITAASQRPEILAENLGIQEKVILGRGLVGNLDPRADRLRQGPYRVYGSILMNVSAFDLHQWIPRVFFNDPTGSSYTLGNNASNAIDIMIKRDLVTYYYRECYVASWTLRGNTNFNEEEPQLLQMLVTFLGKTEEKATWVSPEPDLQSSDAKHWITGDSTLSLGPNTNTSYVTEAQDGSNNPPSVTAVEYPFTRFEFNINNNLWAPTRNALTPQCIRSLGRTTTLDIDLPLTESIADDAYFAPYEGPGQLSFLSSKNLGNSESSSIFDFTRLVYRPRESPRTRGKAEIPQRLRFRAFTDTDGDDSMSATITYPS